MAPSCLIFYLGVTSEVPKLKHHNLFFDEDLGQHACEIYKSPSGLQSHCFTFAAVQKQIIWQRRKVMKTYLF